MCELNAWKKKKKQLTATHAQEKQTEKQQKKKRVQMVSLAVGDIHSEAGGGRQMEGQLQSTVGNNGTVSQHFYTFWGAFV